MTFYHYVGIALFVLFCAAMIWQINSDMKETSRAISRGYGLSNITHSAKVFEATGVDLLGDIDYLNDDRKPARQKNKLPKSKKNSRFNFKM